MGSCVPPHRPAPALHHPLPRQCKKYREQLTPQRKALLQAKLRASELFKDKKALYSKRCGGWWGLVGGCARVHGAAPADGPLPSLQQPFQGEYLGLTQNPKYQKLHAVAKDKLVMADNVRKVNRASGKVSPVPVPTSPGGVRGHADPPLRPQTVPRLLLLTTEHLVLADPKAAQPKTVLSLSDIRSVSVTRFSDGFLALHLKEVPGEGGPRGGGSLGARGVPVGADTPSLPADLHGWGQGRLLARQRPPHRARHPPAPDPHGRHRPVAAPADH